MERIAVAKRSATKLVSTTSRSDKTGLCSCLHLAGRLEPRQRQQRGSGGQRDDNRGQRADTTHTPEKREAGPGERRKEGRRGDEGADPRRRAPQEGRSKKPLGTYYNRHLLPAMSSDFLHAPSAVRANHRQSRRRPNELPIVMCLPQKTKP